MKILALAPATALALVGFIGTAHAQVDHAQQAHESTVLKRQVTYACQSGGQATVTYGFNQQRLPTYASAYVDGKTRFMPLNLNRSDTVDSVFGDENNYSLMTDAMTLYNYHKLGINITNPSGDFSHKGCNVRYVTKL